MCKILPRGRDVGNDNFHPQGFQGDKSGTRVPATLIPGEYNYEVPIRGGILVSTREVHERIPVTPLSSTATNTATSSQLFVLVVQGIAD